MHRTRDYSHGDLVTKGDRNPQDPMAYYIFQTWSVVPASGIAGRIAHLQWAYNGTLATSWEKDLAPSVLSRDEVHQLILAAHAANPLNRAVPATDPHTNGVTL